MFIAPSLLSADFTNLEQEIVNLQNSGADIIHLDVMDGHFVPNLTFGIPIIKQLKKITKLPLDVHLMVTNPHLYFDTLAEIGIDYVSFHSEVCWHLHREVHYAKQRGFKTGIAINPATSIESIKLILPDLDFILIMSVNPGFGGQKFIPSSLDKIEQLNRIRKREKFQFQIEVDGGINNDTVKDVITNGADIIVAGSYILHAESYKKQIDKLRGLI